MDSHIAKICNTLKSSVMNRWVRRGHTWKDLKSRESFDCIKNNSKHTIWLILSQPCLSVCFFPVQPTKNAASHVLHAREKTNLPAMLLIFTSLPLDFLRRGKNAFVTSTAPKKFTAMHRLYSVMGMSSPSAGKPRIPALLTTAHSPENRKIRL